MLAGVPGQESELLQLAAQFDIELEQSARDAQLRRAGLARSDPPPLAMIKISNLSAVSVASSGCRTIARDARSGNSVRTGGR